MAYQSISVDDPEAGGRQNGQHSSSTKRLFSASCLAIAVVALITLDWARLRLFSSGGDTSSPPSTSSPSSSSGLRDDRTPSTGSTNDSSSSISMETSSTSIPLPTGVNLAAWLSLEDWFFVGNNGAIEVASPDDAIAAACLPPLHLDASTGPRWNSETDLFAGLAEHYRALLEKEEDGDGDGDGGGSSSSKTTTLGGYPNDKSKSLGQWGKAYKAIHAFRSSYFDFESELQQLQNLGIKYVRVPVSWCWTDYDPTTTLATKNDSDDSSDDWVYMSDDQVLEKFTCKDPFHDDVYWPAIPKPLVQRFLRACAKYGIGATLGTLS